MTEAIKTRNSRTRAAAQHAAAAQQAGQRSSMTRTLRPRPSRSAATDIVAQQAGNNFSKRRTRQQLQADSSAPASSCSPIANGSSSSAGGGQHAVDLPIAKRTRSASATKPDGCDNRPSIGRSPGQQADEQLQQQMQNPSMDLQFMCQVASNPHLYHMHFKEILAAMSEPNVSEQYRLAALNAADAVWSWGSKAQLAAVADPQLLPYVLQLIQCSQERHIHLDDQFQTRVQRLLCGIIIRAAEKSSADAAVVMECLQAQGQQGIKFLLQQLDSSNVGAKFFSLLAISNLACTEYRRGQAPGVQHIMLQQLYSTAMQQYNGLLLLLGCLQQPDLRYLALSLVHCFALAAPTQLLGDLFSQEQQGSMKLLLEVCDSTSVQIQQGGQKILLWLLHFATASQRQHLMQQLLLRASQQCCEAALSNFLQTAVEHGLSVPQCEAMVQLLGQQRGGPRFRNLVVAGMRLIAQAPAGQQLLLQQGLPALLQTMADQEAPQAAASAAQLVLLLVCTATGPVAIAPHVRDLLLVAAQQSREYAGEVAIQTVYEILRRGSMSPQGAQLPVTTTSPGYVEVVENIAILMTVLQQQPQQQQGSGEQQHQQQQAGGQQQGPEGQQQVLGGQQQQQAPIGPEQQAPPGQQQQPASLLYPRYAQFYAAGVVVLLTHHQQALQALQQECHIDTLLSAVERRGAAASPAASAVSYLALAVPASRQILKAPRRVAVIAGILEDVSAILQQGREAAAAAEGAAVAGDAEHINAVVQKAVASTFKLAAPLLHLLPAAAVCGLGSPYVRELVGLMCRVPCLTMAVLWALTQPSLQSLPDMQLQLAARIQHINAAVTRDLKRQPSQSETAAAQQAKLSLAVNQTQRSHAQMVAACVVRAMPAQLRALEQQIVNAQHLVRVSGLRMALVAREWQLADAARSVMMLRGMQLLGRLSRQLTFQQCMWKHIAAIWRSERAASTPQAVSVS